MYTLEGSVEPNIRRRHYYAAEEGLRLRLRLRLPRVLLRLRLGEVCGWGLAAEEEADS
jgi:hypothetical protein|eukprot:COSAG01_NODE_92_length_27199_cov_100.594649_10_plen_58_part_00